MNKYPFYINDILDLVIAEEPPYDVYDVIAGLICNDYVFEEMVKGEEPDDIEWNTLCVYEDNIIQSFMNKTSDYYAKKVIITVESKL